MKFAMEVRTPVVIIIVVRKRSAHYPKLSHDIVITVIVVFIILL